MKGTEKIIAHIQQNAEAQAAAILAEAQQRCDAVHEEYERRARDSYNERLRAGVKACEDRVDRMDRLARMEAKKSVLSEKQTVLTECFEKAQELIPQMDRERYVEFLARLACEASGTGYEELIFNAEDKAHVAKDVLKAANARLRERGNDGRLTAAEETGSFSGGFIMRQGGIEVNCTVETLVELSRAELSAAAADILFA